MRPRSFDEVLGQPELVGEGGALRAVLATQPLPSLVFWGPPGTGKTTLARIRAEESGYQFVSMSAVTGGKADVKKAVEAALEEKERGTVLFVDEIHRFNKAQQDALLPFVEDGTITLLATTTENPSFEVIGALLSRCRVLVVKRLSEEDLGALLDRAIRDPERGLGDRALTVSPDARRLLLSVADGDARKLLNALELAAGSRTGEEMGREEVERALQDRRSYLYDRAGEEHFNLISALHKSLRGSDPQGAVYWLVRMIEAGEDPLYVARRMVRFASEDVGLADPRALSVALDAVQAVHFVGLPEADLALVQAAVYLATAPKSNSLYRAAGHARADVRGKGSLPVPLHIRNAPTALMKDLGYGPGYLSDHDFPEHVAPQEYLPRGLAGTTYYAPGPFGFEETVARRMAWWAERRRQASGPASGGLGQPGADVPRD
ncbi:MAG: replication-associated recombination protein A [Planctomycetes bacterium]|nr:replication-associated recombination protein A [Planctomycetota bacterium]